MFLQRALQILESLRQRGEDRLVLLGDLNTTGYRDDQHGERTAVHRQLVQSGMKPLTDELLCSAYWKPSPFSPYLPGKLDHVIASGVIEATGAPFPFKDSARHLARAEQVERIPSDFEAVSDHCPVVVTVR